MKFFLMTTILIISCLQVACSNDNSTNTQQQTMKPQSSQTLSARASSSYTSLSETSSAVRRCEAVSSVVIPHEPLPEELANCDALDYFYGINGHEVDYEKARLCALNTPNSEGTVLSSYELLAMIYANGYGVKQDINLATKFACENKESNDVILALDKSKISKSTPFNICSFSIDPNTTTTCGNYLPMQINKNKRELEIKKIITQWPVEDQNAFRQLEQAKDGYIEAYVNGEIDFSTYPDRRQYDAIDEQDAIFFKHFNDGINSKFPKFTSLQFTALDRRLNQVYKKIMFEKNKTFDTGISNESLKDIQRAWLRYRDSWVSFARVRYPKINPDSFAALLTKERIARMQYDFLGISE